MATILIVDDVAIMRGCIRRQLEELGHMVIGEASNGYEAIESYQILKPDIVTMDINMPMLDGVQTMKKIKDNNPDATVIIISAVNDNKQIMSAILNGARGYILKPINKIKLKSAIDKLNLD